MSDENLIEALVDGDWDDDDELEGELASSRVWKVEQLLSWFSDATGTVLQEWSSFPPLQQAFLADQCESVGRVCSHAALAGYLSHIGEGEPSLFPYLAYLNDPCRYQETEIGESLEGEENVSLN